MDSLPLFLDASRIRCLVVGGGNVAFRKLRLLLDAGATCRVVAPRVGEEVAGLVEANGIACEQRKFAKSDVVDVNLVIAATNDSKVNARIRNACDAANVWVNAVDDGPNSTALFPSIVDRDPVTVAISTGGNSPTLARRLRTEIETSLPASLGRLADFLGAQRQRVRGKISSIAARQRFWDLLLDGPIVDMVERGELDAAMAAFASALEGDVQVQGFVSLVGAGPGDADLLTLKALRCLQRADVVYYDNLVGNDVLNRARRDAKMIYVGKKRAFHSVRQDAINELLAADAQDGLRVVRLKGGDPFIFGRGGEEIATLARRGIPFEVVPGITAALGSAAYAGIPLTHRDWAQSVRFVTGHLKQEQTNLDWPELAKPDQTLVVYMGLAGLAAFTRNLVDNGMAPDTPVAVVSRATLPDQIVVTGPLSTIAETVTERGIPGPTTTIIGRVAGLAADHAL